MTSTPLITHPALVARACRWLAGAKKCTVVLSEMTCGWVEVPDAIGFGRQGSVLIECKRSRSDFHADTRKLGRRRGMGMGQFRYYMVPHGLVRAHEFETLIAGVDEPPTETGFKTNFKWGSSGWGLLWWDPRTDKITVQRISQRFKPNQTAENLFLISALNRVQLRIAEPLHQYIRWGTSPAARQAAAAGVGQ